MLQRPQHRLGERLLGLDHVADVVERDRPDGRPPRWPTATAAGSPTALRSGRPGSAPGGSTVGAGAAAARRAASRTRAGRSATTKPGVRSPISSRSRSSAGTPRSSTSSSALRVAPSGRLRPELAVAQVGCPQPGVDRVGHRGRRDERHPWRGHRGRAVRSGSASRPVRRGPRRGSSASTSVISSTPPPSRTVATADATLASRSSARSAPTSGPSSSTRRRSAQTARTRVALPTPAGPDTSTPRLAWRPGFRAARARRGRA